MIKRLTSLALGLGLVIALSVPALAESINARIKVVSPDANTITVVERNTDFTFAVNGDTHFLSVNGTELANGIKSGDLKAGARVSITYTKDADKSLATTVKLRGPFKPPVTAPAQPAPAPEPVPAPVPQP